MLTLTIPVRRTQSSSEDRLLAGVGAISVIKNAIRDYVAHSMAIAALDKRTATRLRAVKLISGMSYSLCSNPSFELLARVHPRIFEAKDL